MSLDDLPIILSANGRVKRREALTALSPATFRLDLGPSALESGNAAKLAQLTSTRVPAPAGSEDAPSVTMGKNVARLALVSQVLIVVALALIVFGMIFLSYRLNYNIDWYYHAAQPYLAELRDHGMSMARHADHSSEAMDHMITESDMLASRSVPALMTAVNHTTDMIARLDRVARNPVLKVSME